MKLEGEHAVIPMDRYNELLDKEKLFEEKAEFIGVRDGMYKWKNFLFSKDDEVIKQTVFEYKKIAAEKVELEYSLEDKEREFDILSWRFDSLKKKFEKIENLWWYKLFY